MSTAAERLIATATEEIGYLEKASNSQLDDKTANAGSANYTKYARDLDNLGLHNGKKNGYAWCDIFVDWCMYTTFGLETMLEMTGQAMGGAGAGCTYSARYYKNMGRFYTSSPQVGDQIFFTKDGGSTMYHTGIVSKVTSSKVYTIEGNTSSASGVVENGGAVAAKSYSISYSKIGGYGRPNWDLVTEEINYTTVNYQATVKVSSSLNCRDYPGTSGTVVKKYYNGEVVTITREYNGWGYTGEGWISLSYVTKITTTTTTTTETQEDDDMITLEQFKQLMGEYRTELRDNDSGTWSEEARQWCIAQGIFQGGDTTSDGNPNYMWEDMMTREQVATVLYRFAQIMGKA